MSASSDAKVNDHIGSSMADESSTFDHLLDDATALLAEVKALEAKSAHYNSLAEQIHAEETSGIKELARVRKSVKSFLKKSDKAVKTSISSSPNKSSNLKMIDTTSLPPPALGELLAKLERKLKQVEFHYPKPPSLILRWALGSTGPFALRPLKLRLAYKQEYESFKLSMTIVSTIMAAINWFFLTNRIVDALHAFVLLYYYSTVTLRELILLVNGSRIRTWWLTHHVLSVILMGSIVIWPKTYCYTSFRLSFLQFSLWIGVIQYLQYRYQIHRLYVLRSLDMAGPMDVVGDGLYAQNLERDFTLLIPFVLIGQMWQLYNGYSLGKMWWSGACTETHTPLAAALFFILGVGNACTTLWTYISRRGKNHKTSFIADYYSPMSPVGRVGSNDRLAGLNSSHRTQSSERLRRNSSSDKLAKKGIAPLSSTTTAASSSNSKSRQVEGSQNRKEI